VTTTGHRAAIPKGRRKVLAAVLALISLPAMLVLVDAVAFYDRNRNNGAMLSSGERREYLLHVPKSYAHGRPTPLVISMHAAGLWPAAQMETSRWNEAADEQGFIVVYPSGVGGDGPRIWRADHEAGLMKEVQFISELIDTLEANYSIDPTRIYANGLSNGGGMAFVLSCRLSDRIAAVGMVAAAHLLPSNWCADRRPVPMVAFHGTADPVTPYHGGKSWAAPRPFPDIPTWTASWAERDRCGPKPTESVVATDVTRIEYPGCADGTAVVLYAVQGGGHTWPGGSLLPEWMVGRNSNGVDATSLMWAFFQEHPLRPTADGTRRN